ncbi:MAG TPA: glutaredoxin [Ghiorsea sp.]|nr:glutaredoxin [Ghiorsea sp.]HIP06825.1 glutaredoxin [Mariprofundaceae bacterium]
MIKKVLLRVMREVAGVIWAFFSFIFTPAKVKRSTEEQAKVDAEVQNMALYQYFGCPFCIKVRKTVRRLKLPLEYRNAQVRGGEHRNTLEKEGGTVKVPCLRIEENGETTWMYESNDIVAYLNKRFDPSLTKNS